MTDYRSRLDRLKEHVWCSWRRHALYSSGHVIGCSRCNRQLGGSDFHGTSLYYGDRSIYWSREMDPGAIKVFWHQFSDDPTGTYYSWEPWAR